LSCDTNDDELEAGLQTDIEDFNVMAKELQPGVWGKVKISLCGHLLGRSMIHNREVFLSELITYERLCREPLLVFDDRLVIMTNQRLYPGKVALPLILSNLAFNQPLTGETLARLAMADPLQKIFREDAAGTDGDDASLLSFEMEPATEDEIQDVGRNENNSSHTNRVDPCTTKNAVEDLQQNGASNQIDESYSWVSSLWTKKKNKKGKAVKRKRNSKVSECPVKETGSGTKKRFIRTLKPTNLMLQSLGLKPGENEIEFVVNSMLQGRQSVKATIWLWSSEDKIVVSDVDGTITKSDVMGHAMPWVGNTWCHDGVARYFSNITSNGWRLMYLTARCIGHAAMTRNYLFEEVEQHGKSGSIELLPNGPVIMAPDSLLTAFNRECIKKKSQEFKIPALQNVKNLFPHGYQPFAAAFGNRQNDLIAYCSVNIPPSKIFIVDESTSVKATSCDYKGTYSNLDNIVDFMFPPKSLPVAGEAYTEHNDLLYWDNSNVLDIDDLESITDNTDQC